jgi:hypothetical protein
LIKFSHRGNFGNAEKFLSNAKKAQYKSILEKYASSGVSALMAATPTDSGLTRDSWGYEIVKNSVGFKIIWTNSNIKEGVPIIILLQYGHGTRSGSFVEGRDIINPAIRPIFDKIADELWKEVSNL